MSSAAIWPIGRPLWPKVGFYNGLFVNYFILPGMWFREWYDFDYILIILIEGNAINVICLQTTLP